MTTDFLFEHSISLYAQFSTSHPKNHDSVPTPLQAAAYFRTKTHYTSPNDTLLHHDSKATVNST